MPGPTLFTHRISHYCVAVERMLAFKGVEYDAQPIRYDNRQELIRRTGQDYVPALLWDGEFVPWQDIPDFLEGKVPTPTLYPGGRRGVAKALEQWGHLVVEERVWRAVVTRVPAILADDSERWVFEEMQTRARGPWSVLEARRPEFEKEMRETLGMVDAMVTEGPWILGEPSLADFGIYGSMSPLLTVGDSVPVDLPHLGSWTARIRGPFG